MIYPEVDLAIVGVDEALARSCGLGLVAHKSVSRVRSCVEVEGTEEVGTVVRVSERISSSSIEMDGSVEIGYKCSY